MKRTLVLVTVLVVVACETSPLGRRQLLLFPPEQVAEMGTTAFQQMKQEFPQSEAPAVREYVVCVTDALVEELAGKQTWEVRVFEREDPNAFALPGGNIGVHTGMLDVAQNQDQLAAVLAHEIAHVLAEHGNERMSTQFATQTGLDLLRVLAGGSGPEREQIFSLLGVGAQVGIILPFSRQHETEADLIGLDLMAKAGFDPRAAVQLWRNMAERGGPSPPEFLSTHPLSETRIEDLQARMPQALKLYEQAVAQGKQPQCRAP